MCRKFLKTTVEALKQAWLGRVQSGEICAMKGGCREKKAAIRTGNDIAHGTAHIQSEISYAEEGKTFRKKSLMSLTID